MIAVDTGSSDRSPQLLADSGLVDHVVTMPRETGFGAAVQAGIDHLPPAGAAIEWIWLLHDDCSPAPGALEALLAAVDADVEIAVTGPKIRAWPRGQRLLEVGVSIAGTGRRVTNLDAGEYDQGQHDEPRDVLAVSTAGALIRREVWDRLGGLDRRFPLFRDDVDFGWRAAKAGFRVTVTPAAVIFHAEAASRGVRPIANTHRRPHRADRQAALTAVLANASVPAMVVGGVRLAVESVLRAVGFAVGKLPGVAYDEIIAVAAVIGRPDRIFRARRARSPLRDGDREHIRSLRPSWSAPYRESLDALLVRLVESVGELRRRGYGVDRSAADRSGWRGAVGRHPLLTMLTVLTVCSFLANRGLWGSQLLQGGGLLPAPDGAGRWWTLYAEPHHDVGAGSDQPTGAYVAVLAVVGAVLLGKAWLVMDVLMLLAVPLAAFGAFVASGRLVTSRSARTFMAVSYGLLPAVTGAVGAGRVGTVATTIGLPWLVLAGAPLLRATGPRWRNVAMAGFVLSVLVAFTPVIWLLAGAGAAVLVGRALLGRDPRRAAQVMVAVLVPALALLPWAWEVLGHPHLFLLEAGPVDVAHQQHSAPGWYWPFGRVGAPGSAPTWFGIGTVLAGLAALLRADRRNRVTACWWVAATGLLGSVVMLRSPVDSGLGPDVVAWVGVPVVVTAAALIAAVGIAADGLAGSVAGASFGWRQLVSPIAIGLAVLTPVLGLGWWVVTAPHGTLSRAPALDVPAYIQQAISDHTRVLVVGREGRGIGYDLVSGDGDRLGDDSVQTSSGSRLEPLVTDLVTGERTGVAKRLARSRIRYVAVERPAGPGLLSTVDQVPGLARTGSDVPHLEIWQLSVPVPASPGPIDGTARAHRLAAQGAVLAVLVVMIGPGLRRRHGARS